jgi:hypothetical protein
MNDSFNDMKFYVHNNFEFDDTVYDRLKVRGYIHFLFSTSALLQNSR